MPDVVGRQLDVAERDIQNAGFKEEVDVAGGGTFGVVNEANWQVCQQEPAAGQAITGTPKLTVDRSCGGNEAPTTTAGNSTSTTAYESPTSSVETTTTAPAETLTADNSPDFAAALAATDDCSDDLANFAFKYAGRTIEFDGAIAAMTNHEGAKTRFDILVVAGNGPEATRGPQFKFRDVNMTDLKLTGAVPPSLGVGTRLRVTANIAEFNRTSCLLFLKPVSTEVR